MREETASVSIKKGLRPYISSGPVLCRTLIRHPNNKLPSSLLSEPMDRPLNGRHGTSGVPTTVPIDNPESDSDDSHVSDSSSSVDSIHSEEINAQFCNRHGRLFHSHSNTPQQPYPLPVDDREIVVATYTPVRRVERTERAPSSRD